MMTQKELETLEKDILALYEAVVLLRMKYPGEMPERVFQYKIVERIKGELLLVAENMVRAAHNRKFAGDPTMRTGRAF